MLKFNDYNNSFNENPAYDFDDTNHYIENILNGNADFKSPSTNEFIIGENSEGIQKSNVEGTIQVPFDILGILRNSPADIGAYQHIIFEEE